MKKNLLRELTFLLSCLLLLFSMLSGCDGCNEEVKQGSPPGDYARLSGELGKLRSVTNGRAMGVGAYDYDGDTKPDLFQLMPDGRVILFLNKGNGILEEQGVIAWVDPPATNSSTISLAVDDFTEDGKPDLVVTYSDGWTILYINVSDAIRPLRQTTDELPNDFIPEDSTHVDE